MNILVLMAGDDRFNRTDEGYPLYLLEFDGKLIVERLIETITGCKAQNYIFAIREEEARKSHLDHVIQLLQPSAQIVMVHGKTAGAACTALLATKHIRKPEPLLILNADEIIEVDYNVVVKEFQERELDAGVVIFPSVHPRYSFVKLDTEGFVIQAAEKIPISRNATAGFYYYRHGDLFCELAENMIRKDARVNDRFYICPVFNELILRQGRIGIHKIESRQYRPLKSMHQMRQFEEQLEDEARA